MYFDSSDTKKRQPQQRYPRIFLLSMYSALAGVCTEILPYVGEGGNRQRVKAHKKAAKGGEVGTTKEYHRVIKNARKSRPARQKLECYPLSERRADINPYPQK